MIRHLSWACLVIAATAAPSLAQDRFNIMYERVAPNGPTYGQVVEEFFASYVFPSELSYGGVGIGRDNVIAERVETNGRGGYWITVRARYSGRAGFVPVSVADRARVYYDNGDVRVDLGGLRGVLNTGSIGQWVADRLPNRPPGGGGENGGDGQGEVVRFRYTIENGSRDTVRFRLPTGRVYVLEPGRRGEYSFTGNPSQARIYVFNSDRSYRLRPGDHHFWYMEDQRRIGLDLED